MTQPLTEALVEAAREATKKDAVERDQVAWNLPRDALESAPEPAEVAQLDWAGFSQAFYPGAGRHDLAAIVAYGAYRRSGRSV